MNELKNPSQWLRRFRLDITSSSNRVYANGLQQVEITVTLEPRDGQTISPESLDSLSLVQIDEEGDARILDHPDLYAHRERDTRFVYHAASGTAPSALTERTANSIRRVFYVTSKRPGGTLSQLYATIWKDENTYAITHVAPFVSSVVIESIAPPLVHDGLFRLDMQPAFRYKLPNFRSRWNDELEEIVGYFGFADPRSILVESTAHFTPSGEPFYERHNHDTALISFELTNDYSQHCTVTAFGVGQAFEVTAPDSGEQFVERLHHMTLHQYFKRFYIAHHNSRSEARSAWSLLDQHGNAYHVEFLVSNSGRALKFHVSAHPA